MNTFVIIFRDPFPPDLKLNDTYAVVVDRFELSDKALLVRSYADSPQQIAQLFGMYGTEEHPHVGVVLKLEGSYYGYYDSALWDWLGRSREVSHA